MALIFVGILIFNLFSGFAVGISETTDIAQIVKFQLYTRENSYYGEPLVVGNKAQLRYSGFDGNLTTVICSHGYFDTAKTSWVRNMKSDYLKVKNVNFITLDFSAVSNNLLYDEVVNFTKDAGKFTGRLLKFLQTEGNLKIENTHLIGHSLGAQILGLAAKTYPKKTIGRISGLDPAAPLYEHGPESERLNQDSAKIVDIIHTCTFFVGIKKPIGTIDFYPNGGYPQPGCESLDFTCHHAKARIYFQKSLTEDPNKFKAQKCKTLQDALKGTCNGEKATMGYNLNYSSPGIYYLKIN